MKLSKVNTKGEITVLCVKVQIFCHRNQRDISF
jgi:hypothetical protein